MKKLKVVTIVGTRPEIIRLSRLIPLLDKFTDHILVHTGQNYDRQLNEVFFEDLDLRAPDIYLNVDTSSFGTVMGDVLKKSEELFIRESPDAVMILGDTNSSIAALVAERMHIPVYHMEAGNRSFDQNVPEELNRKMVDHVATFNLPYNDHSMQNLLREGAHPRFLFKSGSPIFEVFDFYEKKIHSSTILQDLELETKGYFLVSLHRQETVDSDEHLEGALRALQAVRQEWGLPILISTHPRTKNRIANVSKDLLNGLDFHEPFGYLDYNKLQLNAKCVLSDSGTASEESAIMGFPAILMRSATERPEALESGSIFMAGLNADLLISLIKFAIAKSPERTLPEGYQVTNFSERVLGFLLSTASLANLWLSRRSLLRKLDK